MTTFTIPSLEQLNGALINELEHEFLEEKLAWLIVADPDGAFRELMMRADPLADLIKMANFPHRRTLENHGLINHEGRALKGTLSFLLNRGAITSIRDIR